MPITSHRVEAKIGMRGGRRRGSTYAFPGSLRDRDAPSLLERPDYLIISFFLSMMDDDGTVGKEGLGG